MSNPATLLHEILLRWGAQDMSPWQSRGGDDFKTFIEEHCLAMKHLVAISAAIDGLEASGRKTDYFRKNYERWVSWVLNAKGCWTDHNGTSAYKGLFVDDEPVLDMLQALGGVLNDLSPEADPQNIKDLEKVLAEALELVSSDASLPKELKSHLHLLLAEARNCVENFDKLGEFHLRAAIERLIVGIDFARSVSSERSKWSALRDKIVYPALVGVISSAPGVISQLTPG